MRNNIQPTIFHNYPRRTMLGLYIIVFILLELSLRLLSYYGVIRTIQFTPMLFTADINRIYGVWHYPNVQTRHNTACFDVMYRTNSYGARDRERSHTGRSGQQRVVVLGDSFVEGYGVASGKRMTDLLENKTGIEHLNFGTSGDFGSIQEWLLYGALAMNFMHSDVFIFMLPDNDFEDNDPPAQYARQRYRPYLRKSERGGYELYYPMKFEEKLINDRLYEKKHAISISAGKIYDYLSDSFYFMNILRQIIDQPKSYPARIKGLPSYNDFSSSDADMLLFTYEQILDLAKSRNVYIFTIPRHTEFESIIHTGYRFRIVDLLNDFAGQHKNVHYFDLLPYFIDYSQRNNISYTQFFHSCDGHWSELGNAVAAEAVMHYVYNVEF